MNISAKKGLGIKPKLLGWILIFTILALILNTYLLSVQSSLLFLSGLNVFLISFLVLILTSPLLFLAVQISLGPLKKILEGTAYLAKGYLNFETKIKTKDELEEIGDNLNSLETFFKNNLWQLQSQNTHLSSEKYKYEMILSNILQAVIFIDMNYKIIVFNPAAEKITGFKTQNILGKTIDQAIRVKDSLQEIPVSVYCPNTGDRENSRFERSNLKLLHKNQASSRLIDSGDHKDSTFVDMTTILIRDADKHPVGYLITLKDVSQDGQLETMKVDFISMAAHELRTPLTSVRGYLSVFIQENEKNLNPDQKMLLDRISISVQQLTSLAENLLNVSRIERGAISITAKPVDWVKFIKDSVATFLLRANDKKILLEFIEPKEPFPQVQADAPRVVEVLNNLLANAINYTKTGGNIKVWLEHRGNEAITHVSDNGQGIPKEAIPHLFSKFYRASRKLETGVKGNGLGLYISRAIVELHKGKIWANSEQGKGSTFSFSLPVAIQNAKLETSNVSVNV